MMTMVAMSPVTVMTMSPVAVMTVSPVSVMSGSGPVLPVRPPLMFGPEDVVGPVSLWVGKSSLALVHLGGVAAIMVMVVMAALGMDHVMSIISNDKDHLQ